MPCVLPVGRWSQWYPSGPRLAGQGAYLDQVVDQDAVSGPDPGSVGSVDAGAVPSVAAFEGADPAFDAGSPFDRAAERSSVFCGLSGFAGFALAGNHHGADTQVVEAVVDLLLAVAAVGCDGTGWPAGAPGDPLDRGGELGRVGGVALLDGVVQDDAVVVVGQLGLVAELDRFAEAALGDRAGVRVVQADPPLGAVRCLSGQPLPGLGGDPPGRVDQLTEVVHRSGESTTAPARSRVMHTLAPQRRCLGPG